MKLRFILFAFFASMLISPLSAQEISTVDLVGMDDRSIEVTEVRHVISEQSVIELDKSALKYENMLDLAIIRKNVETLASAEFEGRHPAQAGGTLTQEFLKKQLAEIGVALPTTKKYGQDIGRFSSTKSNYKFEFNNFNYQDDYGYSNSFLKDSIITTNEVLFVGYGDYSATVNNFSNLDVSDKVVMYMEGASTNKWGTAHAINNASDKYLLEKKPKAIIKIRDGFSSYFSAYADIKFAVDQRDKDGGHLENIIPIITVNERLANKLLEKAKKSVKQLKFEIEESGYIPPIIIDSKEAISIKSQLTYKDSKAENIIGIIEGTDLKDEYIVLMAHHDHLGKSEYYNDRIYYGADDNASGVASVLEITRIFAKAKKEKIAPRRSIIVMFPTSEEEGLKGASYYVKNPLYPIKSTKACINLDMVGRKDNAYPNNDNYVYITKNDASNDLSLRIKEISAFSPHKTEVVRTESNFSRSDHYSFSKESVPSVMFTGGEHDDYHTKRDTAGAIEYDLLLKRAKLAFLTVWDLANPPKNELVKITETRGN